jgi:hypothetical protein
MNRKHSASHVRDRVGASGRNRFRRHGPSAVMKVMNTLRKLLSSLLHL